MVLSWAKFRLNNNEFPNKPSNLAGNLFRPFINRLQNKYIDEIAKNWLVDHVVKDVMTSFKNLIKEILDSSKKAGEMMQKYV